ncbi:hypothetical protein [Demequina sp.]|uniref:hypothetical protein n=1 Tax=Demequina sp. TaxID=2050685 RepID=UPI0025C5866C|nr:hypothetical protein [Demequina sp.]
MREESGPVNLEFARRVVGRRVLRVEALDFGQEDPGSSIEGTVVRVELGVVFSFNEGAPLTVSWGSGTRLETLVYGEQEFPAVAKPSPRTDITPMFAPICEGSIESVSITYFWAEQAEEIAPGGVLLRGSGGGVSIALESLVVKGGAPDVLLMNNSA